MDFAGPLMPVELPVSIRRSPLIALRAPTTPRPSAAAPMGVTALRPSRRSRRSTVRASLRRRRSVKLRRMRHCMIPQRLVAKPWFGRRTKALESG